jgi:hypothetical protein
VWEGANINRLDGDGKTGFQIAWEQMLGEPSNIESQEMYQMLRQAGASLNTMEESQHPLELGELEPVAPLITLKVYASIQMELELDTMSGRDRLSFPKTAKKRVKFQTDHQFLLSKSRVPLWGFSNGNSLRCPLYRKVTRYNLAENIARLQVQSSPNYKANQGNNAC